jgi:hypothetical protein
MIKDNWSLTNIPPEGDADVPDFFYSLYQAALTEQNRLKVRERLLDNHAMYRSKFDTSVRKKKVFTPVNLFFANVERTKANITANNPIAEVIDMDGIKDGDEETHQRTKLKDSAGNMEIYGYTTEKPYWNRDEQHPDTGVTDSFAVLPSPGIWRDWSKEPPYIVFLYTDYTDVIEKIYETEGVASESVYDLLGEAREEHRPNMQTINTASTSSKSTYGRYDVPMSPVGGKQVGGKPFQKGLIIEIWIRGAKGEIENDIPMIDPEGQPILDPLSGEPLYEKVKKDKYPDGIRKVTIIRKDLIRAKDKTPNSYMVLDDCPNPNINPELEIEVARNTYPWARIPCIKTDSYTDTQSSYGFSAGEQTADLLIKISNIFTRLFAYVDQALSPTLIIEKFCGITREMIYEQVGKSRLVLMPTKPNADIRFLQTPNLPATFFNVLNIILQFYDRIYQIEDADRGKSPSRIIAASAIVALQERNAVLMQSKVESIEYIAGERGKWAIGLYQNFGTKEEIVSVNETPKSFQGVKFAQRRFNYQIEVGSTVPKTSLRTEEQVRWLAGLRMIDLRTILETIGFPNWKTVVERNGENQLDMALQILIDAGLPKQEAISLKQWLMQPQGGPGDTGKSESTGIINKPETTPRGFQGGAVPTQIKGEM